ncbi:MAG: DUF1656 domain-containing protein [Acidisphaera sp.]|nr:DUF1656 domain-containing protein [Acidisphaera sp.]
MNVFGVFLPPILAYLAVALVLYLPLRWVLGRARLWRDVWNPPLVDAALYVCVLGALVHWL